MRVRLDWGGQGSAQQLDVRLDHHGVLSALVEIREQQWRVGMRVEHGTRNDVGVQVWGVVAEGEVGPGFGVGLVASPRDVRHADVVQTAVSCRRRIQGSKVSQVPIDPVANLPARNAAPTKNPAAPKSRARFAPRSAAVAANEVMTGPIDAPVISVQ